MFRKKPAPEAAPPPPLPAPPATFPDGTPFPGQDHLTTLQVVSRTAYAGLLGVGEVGAPDADRLGNYLTSRGRRS